MKDLIRYFNERLSRPVNWKKDPVSPGPVVTISREYGCQGKTIANLLVEKINRNGYQSWRWISKEILESLANKLKLNPSVITEINNYEDRKLSDYIALLLSTDQYPGEKKIKQKLAEIILSFATEGNVIIVGRAGYFITGHIEKAVHVRLTAPLNWRTEHFAERRNLSYHEAMRIVETMGKKRLEFLNYFASHYQHRPHDFVFDTSQISNQEIVNKVYKHLVNKELI